MAARQLCATDLRRLVLAIQRLAVLDRATDFETSLVPRPLHVMRCLRSSSSGRAIQTALATSSAADLTGMRDPGGGSQAFGSRGLLLAHTDARHHEGVVVASVRQRGALPDS